MVVRAGLARADPVFVRYLCSGSTAALTHFAVLLTLVETLGVATTAASALGFAAATGVNYSLQYYWVFESSDQHRRTFVRYLGVTLSMLGVNTALFWWLVTALGWWYPLAQGLVIGVIMVLNFLLNQHFTFRPRERAAPRQLVPARSGPRSETPRQ